MACFGKYMVEIPIKTAHKMGTADKTQGAAILAQFISIKFLQLPSNELQFLIQESVETALAFDKAIENAQWCTVFVLVRKGGVKAEDS